MARGVFKATSSQRQHQKVERQNKRDLSDSDSSDTSANKSKAAEKKSKPTKKKSKQVRIDRKSTRSSRKSEGSSDESDFDTAGYRLAGHRVARAHGGSTAERDSEESSFASSDNEDDEDETVYEEQDRFKKKGETIEGRSDAHVLCPGVKFPSNLDAAKSTTSRQAFGIEISKAFTSPPDVTIFDTDYLALSHVVDSLLEGHAPPPPPPQAEKGQAWSPGGFGMMASIFDAIPEGPIRTAVAELFRTIPDRMDLVEDYPRMHEGGLSKAIQLAMEECHGVLEPLDFDPLIIQNILESIIPPGGTVFTPLGHFSNYPPASAVVNDHTLGINTSTYSGERLAKKHGPSLSNMAHIDAFPFPSRPGAKGALVYPEVRSRPHSIIDGEDGSGVPIRHEVDRTYIDFALVALYKRAFAKTVTVCTGSQARSMMKNVAQAIELNGAGEVFSTSVLMKDLAGVENGSGKYNSGTSSYDLVVVSTSDSNGTVAQSVMLGVNQWCAAGACSKICNSASVYHSAQVTDAAENLLAVLTVGEDPPPEFRSIFANDGVPCQQASTLHHVSHLVKNRNTLRSIEIESDSIMSAEDIPEAIWQMHIKKGDVERIPPPRSQFQDVQQETSWLEYLCCCSSRRASKTLNKQVHPDDRDPTGQATINGTQKRARTGSASQALQVKNVAGFNVDGNTAAVSAGHDGQNHQNWYTCTRFLLDRSTVTYDSKGKVVKVKNSYVDKSGRTDWDQLLWDLYNAGLLVHDLTNHGTEVKARRDLRRKVFPKLAGEPGWDTKWR